MNHIRIFKERSRIHSFYSMWRGGCTCGHDWQFWFFGAALGYGIEHLRRHCADC